MIRTLFLFLIFLGISTSLTSCVIVAQNNSYSGPEIRPLALEEYYSKDRSYTGYHETLIRLDDAFDIKHILLKTDFGEVDIDFYEQRVKNDSLILVFPILAGRQIADYFAEYFAEAGFDVVIIQRDGQFRKPANIDRLEELLRSNVIRDRIALDFFENVYAKKQFGSFGISRGAINAAVTAGVDSRLKYNVLALGGRDLPRLLTLSNDPWAKKFRKKVLTEKNINEEEFYSFLQTNIKTDPKVVASYLDARNTLMFLSLLDKTVNIRYGLQLRRQIGRPRTIFFPTDHYLGLFYTQYVKFLPPVGPICLFPLDYVETESTAFFRESFQSNRGTWKRRFYSVLNLPGQLLGMILGPVF